MVLSGSREAVKLLLTASQHQYLVSELVQELCGRLPSCTTDEHGELLVEWVSCPFGSGSITHRFCWVSLHCQRDVCFVVDSIQLPRGDRSQEKQLRKCENKLMILLLQHTEFSLDRSCNMYVLRVYMYVELGGGGVGVTQVIFQ